MKKQPQKTPGTGWVVKQVAELPSSAMNQVEAKNVKKQPRKTKRSKPKTYHGLDWKEQEEYGRFLEKTFDKAGTGLILIIIFGELMKFSLETIKKSKLDSEDWLQKFAPKINTYRMKQLIRIAYQKENSVTLQHVIELAKKDGWR